MVGVLEDFKNTMGVFSGLKLHILVGNGIRIRFLIELLVWGVSRKALLPKFKHSLPVKMLWCQIFGMRRLIGVI